MKKTLLSISILAVFFSCSKIEEVEEPVRQVSGEAEAVVPVLFGVSGNVSTKASAETAFSKDSVFCVAYAPIDSSGVGTKVSEVTQANLTKFYLTTTKGSSQTLVSTNTEFIGSAGNNYTAAGMFWPSEDQSYHFYASNKQLSTVSGQYSQVVCAADIDVIYACNANPTYKAVNSLAFNHVYGRIGSVSISAPSGFTGTLTSASISVSKNGTFNVATGQWVSKAANQNISLSSSNDVWIVPGTYTMSVTFNLSDGTTSKTGINKTGEVELIANNVNNISVVVSDNYTYDIVVSPSSANMSVGENKAFSASYRTKYNGSVISTKDVTSAASWTSDKTAVATVSSGTAHAVGTGTAKLTASYKSVNGTATITVDDPITSYDNPVVTVTYSPSSFNADGGTATPTVTYKQIAHHASGSTEEITSGGTVTYSQVSAVTGFSLASDGKVTAQANSGSARSYKVNVSVSLNEKSGSKQVTLTQSADEIVSWDKPVVSLSYTPAGLPNSGGTATPVLSYSQVGHLKSGGTRTVTTGAESIYYTAPSAYCTIDSGGNVTTVPLSDTSTCYVLESDGTMTLKSYAGKTETYYDDIEITYFAYDTNPIAYTGGTSYPSINFKQKRRDVRSSTLRRFVNVYVYVTCNGVTSDAAIFSLFQDGDPGEETITYPTNDGTVTYSGTGTGFTLNSNHSVTAASNVGTTSYYYGGPMTTLTYNPSSFTAAGGTATPTVTYKQSKYSVRSSTSSRSMTVTVTVNAHGKSKTATCNVVQSGDPGQGETYLGPITSGATVEFVGMTVPGDGTKVPEGFSMNWTTGALTAAQNTSSSSRGAHVTVKVTLNNKVGYGAVDVQQSGAVIINFDNDK